MEQAKWPTHYWRGSEYLRQDVGEPPPLTIGCGLILETPAYAGSARWRVVDIWISYARHGRFDPGVHAFLELVSTNEDDDRWMRG